MPLLIAALLGLSAAIIVLYPLLGLDRDVAADSVAASALSDDAERERSAKLALRDVNFDYRIGNLDEDDFVALRDRYERRALAALKTRYEREQALDTLIDRQLAALRAKKGGAATPPAGSADGVAADRATDKKTIDDKAGGGRAGHSPMARAASNTGRPASNAPRVRRKRGV